MIIKCMLLFNYNLHEGRPTTYRTRYNSNVIGVIFERSRDEISFVFPLGLRGYQA